MLPLELVEKEGLIFAAEMARRQRASGRPCVHFSSARFHSPFASVLFSPLAGRGGSTKVQADRDNLGSVNCLTSTGDFETCGRCEMSQREAVPGGDEFSVGAVSEQQVNVVTRRGDTSRGR